MGDLGFFFRDGSYFITACVSLNLSIPLIVYIHFCKQLLIFPKTGSILCSFIYYAIKEHIFCELSNKIACVAVILDLHFSFSVQISLLKSRVGIFFLPKTL